MQYLEIIEAPESFPITLNELKQHIRLDVADEEFSIEQSILPASHNTAASYSLEGAVVDVSNCTATVVLNAGSCGVAGTVAVKIQKSLTGLGSWVDVESFTTVTTSNDNEVYTKEYTGDLPYIRVLATVAVNACQFSVEVHKHSLLTVEDDVLTGFIATATKEAEEWQSRRFVEQTLRLNLTYWDSYGIDLLVRPVQSIEEITYLDTSNVRQTLSSANYTLVNGVVYPVSGATWPSALVFPGSIQIDFIAGYESNDDVPAFTKSAILMKAGLLWNHREGDMPQNALSCIRMLLDNGLWKLKGFGY